MALRGEAGPEGTEEGPAVGRRTPAHRKPCLLAIAAGRGEMGAAGWGPLAARGSGRTEEENKGERKP